MLKKDKKIIILAGCLAAIIGIGLAATLLLLPTFKLSSSSVTLEAGEAFEAKAFIEDTKNLNPDQIKIAGAVDPQKPGDYEITYSYEKIKKTLTVKVVDTIAPQLVPMKDFSVFAGEPVTAEMLATVTDKTDCTLKLDSDGQDLSKIGEYTVSVTATDQGGNLAECKVKVQIKDPDIKPPIISGAEDKTIQKGSKFDPKKGITVTDDYDKSPALTIDTGKLNTQKAGKYIITYTATDRSGNQSTIERTIKVVEPAPLTSTANYLDQRGVANQPYLVAVNRAMCTVTIYKKDASGNYTVPVKAMVCSVGRSGHQTPVGRYNTTDRYQWRLMVDGSYGRYAIRVNGGIMFHSVCYYTKNEADLEYMEYNKLGSPASLGCIRLCLADIKWIYDNCPKGFPAVIYDDPSTPGPLGKPESIKIDVNDTEKRGYDPTDWSQKSPWNQ